MRRKKSTARREHIVATRRSSSSEDDLSLDVDQKEVPAPTYDAASSSVVPQHRGGVPSQRDEFTRK
jgi:hypothetical protein